MHSRSRARRAPLHRKDRTGQRNWVRRTLIGLNIFVALCIVAAGGALYYAHYRYSQIKKVAVGHLHAVDTSANQPQTILLVGDNSRCALDGKQTNAFGTCSEVGGGRSDVTMLLHLDPQSRRASVLSIPRDLWLPVPGTTDELRVDAALNKGPGFLVQTIEEDLGIPIDHYVSLNFDSFQGVVSDLGGMQMYFPVPVKDSYSALNVPQPGCQSLNGFEALAVVRARHLYYLQGGEWRYDGEGDLSRIQRDHEFLRVLASQVSQRGLSNPLTANALLGSIAPQLEVDQGFSLADMVSLVRTFHGVDPNTVPTFTLPVVVDPNTYYYKGANLGDVVFPVQPDDQQTIAQFLGQPAPAASVPPPGTTVAVIDGSGAYGRYSTAGAITSGLGEVGYQVTGTSTTQAVGHPAETVIHYAPGQLAAAQQLLSYISGSAALAQGDTPPGTDLAVVVGSETALNSPPSAQGPTGASGAAGTATTVPPTTTTPTTAPAAPSNPAGQATPAEQPLPAYDPTACPA